ncbi:hypothetical protein JCM11251_006816 [Rhodosporidiobolus azoricus]
MPSTPSFNLRRLVLSSLFSLALVGLAIATPTPATVLSRRDDVSGLQSSSRLTQQQVDGVEGLLNRTALKSWEIGAHLQALIEFNHPSLSPFSSEDDWADVSPSTSFSSSDPFPYEVIARAAQIVADKPSNEGQLMPDGSAADPAAVGPFVVLAANLTRDGERLAPWNGTSVTREQAWTAMQGQVRELLEATPRTQDGAISHRVSEVQLWSDFVYMVPPFFAYLGALTSNTTLLQLAYDQARLYRQYLRADSGSGQGLWRHIYVGSGGTSNEADPGLWATGNGWAASGMLRVVATLVNADADWEDSFENQARDLAGWAREIVEASWALPRRNGLLHNYLNETSTFADASSTALMIASTYRLAALASEHSELSSSAPSAQALSTAESAYLTLTSGSGDHISSSGVLSPVANPMEYSSQLQNVDSDGGGNISPEGEAFILNMEAARRDFIQEGGKVSTDAREVEGGNGTGRTAGSVALASLALAAVFFLA